MGLIGNLFNFQTQTSNTESDFFAHKNQEKQKAIEDRIKIENQIELINGLINIDTNRESQLKRPLIG